jgi:ATP-binding cassette subfamily B protein
MLRLLGVIRAFRPWVAIVLVLAFVQSVANLYLPRLMADIVDQGIARGDTRRIFTIGGVMLLVAIAATGTAIASSYFNSKIATGFGRIVRGPRWSGRPYLISIHLPPW